MMLFISAALFAQDAVADNMLLYQRSIGGWPKHINEVKIDYTKPISEIEQQAIKADSLKKDATIDNQATTKEIRYLLKTYSQTSNKKYLSSAEKGIRYLLQMQHSNGGWPQYYPDTLAYRDQITYNDNAMINAMNVLWDVVNRSKDFEAVNVSLVEPSRRAIAKGVECILKTQIRVNGKLTAWCAQYDKTTLQPAKARKFEPPSISAMESVGIVAFLMKLKDPTPEIKNAVTRAVEWFELVKIKGYKTEIINAPNQPKGKDRVLVPAEGKNVWARFYDIYTNKPIFIGRDGIIRASLAEIDNERRVGYGWYGTWPKEILKKQYPNWLTANNK